MKRDERRVGSAKVGGAKVVYRKRSNTDAQQDTVPPPASPHLHLAPGLSLLHPAHLQSEINPAREHRKWVKSPFLHSSPHSEGILVGGKATWLTHVWDGGLCVCVCVGGYERWRDGRHDWERQRGRNFFSLWSSIGSAACCLVTAAPFEKHSVSLEISLKIHPQSAYQTFVLTIGQQHAISRKQCCIASLLWVELIIYLFIHLRLTSLMLVWYFLCVFGTQLADSPFCVIKHNDSTLG